MLGTVWSPAQILHSGLLAFSAGNPLRSSSVKRFLLDPILTLVTLVVMTPVSIFYCLLVIALGTVNPRSLLIQRAINGFARTWLFFSFTRLTVEGFADPKAQYVVVSNHSSWLDIMADFAAADFPIRFLAKAGLFKVPFLGWAFNAIGIVKVNRKGGTDARREMNEGVRIAASRGQSLMVYPEGTRTRDGELQDFKRGAFAIAIDTGLPILPITLYGAYNAWPAGSLVRGGNITAVIGDPIPTEGLTRADLNDLMERSHKAVSNTLAELKHRN
jgi:1-acyl-sn-glycerol-3-phosphate acyltransferase